MFDQYIIRHMEGAEAEHGVWNQEYQERTRKMSRYGSGIGVELYKVLEKRGLILHEAFPVPLLKMGRVRSRCFLLRMTGTELGSWG